MHDCATTDTLLAVWRYRDDLEPHEIASNLVTLFIADDHGQGLPEFLSDNWDQSSNAFIVDFLHAAVCGLAGEMYDDQYAYESYGEYGERFGELRAGANSNCPTVQQTIVMRPNLISSNMNIEFIN